MMYLGAMSKPSNNGSIVKLGRGIFQDTSPVNNSIVVENTTLSSDHNGRNNRSFSFAGDINSYIAINNNEYIRLTNEASWFFFCKNEIPDIAILYKYGSSGDRGWNIQGDGGKMRIALTQDGTTIALHYTTNQVVFDNTWHLYGITFNNGVLRFFIDGVEITDITKTTDIAITSIYPSVAILRIGRYNKCLISNVKITKRALVLSSIKKEYKYYRSH